MTAKLSQTTEEVTESPKGASAQGWWEQVVLWVGEGHRAQGPEESGGKESRRDRFQLPRQAPKLQKKILSRNIKNKSERCDTRKARTNHGSFECNGQGHKPLEVGDVRMKSECYPTVPRKKQNSVDTLINRQFMFGVRLLKL